MALQRMAVKRNLLLLSNSTLHPTGYLEYAADHIQQFLRGCGVNEVPRFPRESPSIYFCLLDTWYVFRVLQGSERSFERDFRNEVVQDTDEHDFWSSDDLVGRSCLSHTHCGSRMSMQQLPGRLLRRGVSPSPQFTLLRTHILLLARPRLGARTYCRRCPPSGHFYWWRKHIPAAGQPLQEECAGYHSQVKKHEQSLWY